MKRNHSIIRKFALLNLSLLAVACGKDAKEAINNVTEEPTLQGDFETACEGSTLLDASEKVRMEFLGNSIARTQNFYSDEKCTQALGHITYDGSFTVDDEASEGKLSAIDYNYKKVQIRVEKQKLADLLNAANFCGIDNYEPKKTYTITGKQTKGLCPLDNVPAKKYGTYKLEGKRLVLDAVDLNEIASKKGERSSELNVTLNRD